MTRAQFPRIRANKPKTRTGCMRCKRQRVKCTEERPACVRCSRAGAECEYPQLPILPTANEQRSTESGISGGKHSTNTSSARRPSAATHARSKAGDRGDSGFGKIYPDEVLSAALIRGIPLAFNLSYTECLDLDRYRYCIATRTTHTVGPEFLCQTVLREMPRDLVVRYSLIGFGALDRAVEMQLRTRRRGRFQTKDEFLRSMNQRNDAAGREAREHYERATRYHSMALRTLTQQMEMEQRRTPQAPVDLSSKYRTLLIRTLLFVLFECRQFNGSGVSNLALAGMQSLRQMVNVAGGSDVSVKSVALTTSTTETLAAATSVLSPRASLGVQQREPQGAHSCEGNTRRLHLGTGNKDTAKSPLHNKLDEDGVKDAEYTLTRLAAVGTTGGAVMQRGILPAVLRDQSFDLAEPQYDMPIPETKQEIFRRSWELQYNAWSIWFTGVDRAKLTLDASYALKTQNEVLVLLQQCEDWLPRVDERLRLHDTRSPFPMPFRYGDGDTEGERAGDGLGVYGGIFGDGGLGAGAGFVDPQAGLGGIGESGFYEERYDVHGRHKSKEDVAYERRALKEMVFRVHMSRLMLALIDTSKAAEFEDDTQMENVIEQGRRQNDGTCAGSTLSSRHETIWQSVEVDHIDPALRGRSQPNAISASTEEYIKSIIREEPRFLVSLAFELIQELPPIEVHNYSFDTKALLVARIALGMRPRGDAEETETRKIDEEDKKMWRDAESIMQWFEED